MSSHRRLKKEGSILEVTFGINYLLYNNCVYICVYIYRVVCNIELVYSTR